jgi:uncharacterized phiE125 gp8 family phage protein
MAYKIITPAAAVIDLPTVKAHLRVDHAFDDSLISAYLFAAMEYAQHYTGVAIGEQEVEVALDGFPCGAISLPLAPASSIVSITYVDEAATEQTLATTAYALDNYGLSHWAMSAAGSDWPATYEAANVVRVRYMAGSEGISRAVKAAILLIVGHLYENRQEATDKKLASVPLGVNALLDTVKVWAI